MLQKESLEKIKELEEELENKDILIEALTNQIKRLKKESNKVPPIVAICPPKIDNAIVNDKISISPSEIDNAMVNKQIAVCPTKVEHVIADKQLKVSLPELENNIVDNELAISPNKVENIAVDNEVAISNNLEEVECKDYLPNPLFIEEVQNLFKPGKNKVTFKVNFTIEKFINFLEENYEFSLTNKRMIAYKNPIKLYIETNLHKIIKLLIENINNYSLRRLCSSFYALYCCISEYYRKVIAHDIIIFCKDNSRLLFLLSALFNNIAFDCDEFYIVLKSIMNHQYMIDMTLYEEDDISEHFLQIQKNFNLNNEKSIFTLFDDYLDCPSLFINNKISSCVIEKGFSLRMLCNYVDWEYTFNKFINEKLIPKLRETKSSALAYFAGILAMNAYRLFDQNEGTSAVINQLFTMIGECNDLSLACYLICKQLNYAGCESWIIVNESNLIGKGFNVEELRNKLLI